MDNCGRFSSWRMGNAVGTVDAGIHVRCLEISEAIEEERMVMNGAEKE